LYNGQVFTQPENAGVVRLGQADDYIGVILELKAAECFLQVSRTQFSSSAGQNMAEGEGIEPPTAIRLPSTDLKSARPTRAYPPPAEL